MNRSYRKNSILIGIDEVGRGSIAGPVAVGAFALFSRKSEKIFKGVKESKQLSETKREEWFKAIKDVKSIGLADFRVSFRGQKIIDYKGINFAIKEALSEALNGLNVSPKIARVMLDGGLKAPARYENQKTIVKGDEKEIAIALASICAKVLRDRRMKNLAKQIPLYGFDKHKGYGTKEHYTAIKRYGISSIHRKSYLLK